MNRKAIDSSICSILLPFISGFAQAYSLTEAISRCQRRRRLVLISAVLAAAARNRKRKGKKRKRRELKERPRYYEWVREFAGIYDETLENLPDRHAWERWHGLTVEQFKHLLSILSHRLTKRRTARGDPIPASARLMLTLRYLRGDTVFALQQAYAVGESTAYVIIHETCAAIVDLLFSRVIRFPTTHSQCLAVMHGFYTRCGFTNVIGAVDGTHVDIKMPPGVHTVDFIDKDQHKSVVFQCCVDHNYVFTNVYGLWPGSAHDSMVLRGSKLFHKGEHGELSPAGMQCVILGDSGYPLKQWLITPISARTDVSDMHRDSVDRYNNLHSSTRMFVEQTFGFCKRIWPRIAGVLTLECTDHIRNVVLACMIMYNWYVLSEMGRLESWLSGEPNWGTVDRSKVHACHRDLDARAELWPKQTGENGSEKRRRMALMDMVVVRTR